MQRPNYTMIYKSPKGYTPPDEEKLRQDTQNPNFNSLQYRKKPINRTPRILKYHDCISINDIGTVILGCNELTGRIWDGYVWGFENLQSYGSENSAVFKIHLKSNITNLSFIEENIFVATQANGCVQIWSTRSGKVSQNTYCMFLIGENKEHAGVVLAMDTLNKRSLLVTGCSQSLLKIWEIGKADLCSIHTLHNAHADSISAISSCPDSESVFATCSLDRSALIWDYRQQRPATGLYENHSVDFTAINWRDLNKTNNELVYLGDASGEVHVVDTKMPNKILGNIQVHTRPITKLKFNGSKLAVIGETNLVRIYENSITSPELSECIYKDSTATNNIRDALWNPQNFKELLTVGWDSKLHRHLIS